MTLPYHAPKLYFKRYNVVGGQTAALHCALQFVTLVMTLPCSAGLIPTKKEMPDLKLYPVRQPICAGRKSPETPEKYLWDIRVLCVYAGNTAG